MAKLLSFHEIFRGNGAAGGLRAYGIFLGLTVIAAVFLAVTLPAGQALAGEIIKAAYTGLETEVPESPRLGLVHPTISLYQVSTGGVNEKVQDWCDAACGNVSQAIGEYFGGEIKVIPEDVFESGSSLDEEMKEVEALYNTVTITISGTWRGASSFPKPYRNFDYSLGDLGELFDALEVDALIFVDGVDQVKTGGRKAFELIGFLAAGAVFSKATYLDVGLVGRSGKLLWYRMVGSLHQTDFRDPEGAKAYVQNVFEGFPLK